MTQKKVNLQRIAKDKTRIITYKKRKACLYKKASELSTLCGVETCLIVYGPTKATDDVVSEPEIWPSDKTKFRDIIHKYINSVSNSCRKTYHVETFVNDLGKAKEVETNKRVKRNNKYFSWEEKLDKCSQEQLIGIYYAVENKLQEALTRQYHSTIRVRDHDATETFYQNYNMPQYFPQQQQIQGSMFPNNNNMGQGYSFITSHDYQIPMDTNLVESFDELGLTQGSMMSNGNVNDTQWTQRQAPYDNVESVLQRSAAAFYSNSFAEFQVPFNNAPWRLTNNLVDEWFLSQKKPI